LKEKLVKAERRSGSVYPVLRSAKTVNPGAGHLAAAKEVESQGKLIVAGAYSNPTDGAMFVFKDYSKEEIHKFVQSDPYVVNGLVTSWQIKEWTAVVGTGEV